MSLDVIKEGDVLVTQMTTPDMVPAMTRAAAIVTDEGGMTCHAAIVARELGIPCVVGAVDATKVLKNGMLVTVHGQMGVVYEGIEKKKEAPTMVAAIATTSVRSPEPRSWSTSGVPNKAEEYAQLPVQGVGLMRIEFLFTWYITRAPSSFDRTGQVRKSWSKSSHRASRWSGKAFYPRPVFFEHRTSRPTSTTI